MLGSAWEHMLCSPCSVSWLQLTVLGTGTPVKALETGQVLGLQVEVLVGTEYKDPGVKAQDATDGTVNKVAVCGASNLQGPLTVPTLPGQPYVVTYTVSDASGNVAATAFR